VRLLIVSQYFWPEEFRINELVADMGIRGHEITVLTGKPNYPGGAVFEEFSREPRRFASYAGARVIRVPMLVRGRGRVRLALNYVSFALGATVVGLTSLANRRFDAIFVFAPSPITVCAPAVIFRALRGWPIGLWVLDQWPESLAATGALRSEGLLTMVGWFVRFAYTRCALILSSSKRLMPQIAGYCRPGQRIEYFPNWAESPYDAESTESAAEISVRPGNFNVMFAGNIGEAQDFPTILDAAEQLRQIAEIRWLIVGAGRMAPWVSSEILRRGLEDSVIMLGRFPANRIPSLFRHADALLVSLKADPIFALTAPGKIQSYLASGKPVLAMLDGEGAALIDESGAGMTSPAGDATGLAENVLRLFALSPEERATLGANGAAYARREFDRTALLDRLEGWLFELVSESRGAVAS
jgi:colanic acid biosynthesis glycosyl transferase WcaI